MLKVITFVQTIFSNIIVFQDDRKARVIFFVLICLVFASVAVYILQTGDLIQKTFLETAYESKVGKAVLAQVNLRMSSSAKHFSLVLVEEKLANSSDFVPVEQVQYIPLTASLADGNQLVSNLR